MPPGFAPGSLRWKLKIILQTKIILFKRTIFHPLIKYTYANSLQNTGLSILAVLPFCQ